MSKYTARVTIMALLGALTADALATLATLISSTPVAKRAAAIKAHNRALFTAAVDAFDGKASSAVRQLAFHVRAYPYVTAAGAAFAIDGGIKRGMATYVVSVDGNSTYGVVQGVDGKPAAARITDRYTGTLALDKAYTAYAARREGMPYVVKGKGKYAVSNNGAHVNARMVSVDGYTASAKAFDVYRASGGKGTGRAWRAADGNSGGAVKGKRGKGSSSK